MKTISNQHNIYRTFLLTAIVLLFTGATFAGNNKTEIHKPVYREVVDKPAELVNGYDALKQQIAYPRAAQLAGYEGKVVVKVYVNESGKVDDLDFIQNTGGGFETSVEKAVKSARFNPAVYKNHPVKSVAVLTFRFQLDSN